MWSSENSYSPGAGAGEEDDADDGADEALAGAGRVDVRGESVIAMRGEAARESGAEAAPGARSLRRL